MPHKKISYMKTAKFLTVIIISILTVSVFGQENSASVWVTVEDLNILPNEENNLKSSNATFQNIIDTYNISSIEQALPSSRKEELLKVYELNCDCNEGLLIQAINNSNLPLSKPEHGPEYETLYTPNDYSTTFSEDYALDLIKAQGAWNTTMGSSAVDIAILDNMGNVHWFCTDLIFQCEECTLDGNLAWLSVQK